MARKIHGGSKEVVPSNKEASPHFPISIAVNSNPTNLQFPSTSNKMQTTLPNQTSKEIGQPAPHLHHTSIINSLPSFFPKNRARTFLTTLLNTTTTPVYKPQPTSHFTTTTTTVDSPIHNYYSLIIIFFITMSITKLNHFLVENVTLNTMHIICLFLCVAEFFLLHLLPTWVGRICCNLLTKTQLGFTGDYEDGDVKNKKQDSRVCSSVHQEAEDGCLGGEDLEVVMEKLGFSYGEKLQKKLDSDDLYDLFEMEKPSLEEVKCAFDVFDENRDGFIDAVELQRVLCNLGFKEGLELESCRRMIGSFDHNGDERIDFDEFVEFMENASC